MPKIDRFIEHLYRQGGDHLIVSSGAPVTVARGGGNHPVTSTAPNRDQVEELLLEILPDAPSGESSESGGEDAARHEFSYEAPAGSVHVRALRSTESVELLVVPASEDPASDGSGESAHVAEPTAASAEAPPVTGSSPATDAAPRDAAAIERLFRMMVDLGCSDLHVSAGNRPLFRKDGDILALGEEAELTPDESRHLLLEIAPERNRKQFEERHDTDFAYEIPGVARFRCNLFMDRLGMGGVFRQIPSEIWTVEDLGLPDSVVELCHLPKGLVLVTGPTGSGKSTTLAAMLDYVNKTRSEHIITIEDPIEFVHRNQKCLINQREVGEHTESFKIALRAALREDPDVVLVGEMRDLDTVAIALETAETGHLVFGTLHTNTAPSTVDRIIDQFPAAQQAQIRAMLADTLKAVIAQTLCKRKQGGRTAALEILMVTPAVSNLIREGKTFQIPSMMQTGRNQGMITFNDALLELVRSGEVDPSEAYRKSVAKNEFKTLLERNGMKVDALAL